MISIYENERDNYPDLPADVQVFHCTKASPMDLSIKDKVVELKQLWIHDDAEEIAESDSGRYVTFKCPNCTIETTIDLGD